MVIGRIHGRETQRDRVFAGLQILESSFMVACPLGNRLPFNRLGVANMSMLSCR